MKKCSNNWELFEILQFFIKRTVLTFSIGSRCKRIFGRIRSREMKNEGSAFETIPGKISYDHFPQSCSSSKIDIVSKTFEYRDSGSVVRLVHESGYKSRVRSIPRFCKLHSLIFHSPSSLIRQMNKRSLHFSDTIPRTTRCRITVANIK